jgi:hypothetical protein
LTTIQPGTTGRKRWKADHRLPQQKDKSYRQLVRTARKVQVQRHLAETVDPQAVLTTEMLAARFATTIRTIDRWQTDPRMNFPPPDLKIFRRKFWRLATVQKWEREYVEVSAA